MNKPVFAVVVCFNGQQWVERCFGALASSRYPITAILVDNNSTDQTVALVRSNFPSVQIIQNRSNAGFGKGNNQGIALALAQQADYIFLLNQDAWPDGDTVASLVDAMESTSYGIISPMHYAPDKRKLDRNFESCLRRDYSAETIRGWGETGSSDIHPSGFINAAAWMVRRSCLETVGGFGSLFFHYGEDRDYVQRMDYYGVRLGVLPSAAIIHDRAGRDSDDQRNSREKLIRYYYVGSLARVVDIKKGLVTAVAAVTWWNIKEFAFLFVKGRLEALPVFFLVMARWLAKLKSIRHYRSQIAERVPYRFL